MSPKEAAGATQTNTCDRCRVLKVKCVPVDKEDGVESVDSSLVGSSSIRDGANGREHVADGAGGEEKKQPCKRCLKAGVGCVFRYEFKKSGRPPGSTAKRSRSKERSASRRSASPIRRASSSTQPSHNNLPESYSSSHSQSHPHPQQHTHSQGYPDLRQPEPTFLSPIDHTPDAHHAAHEHEHPWGPIRDSIFGSARTALNVSADTTQPWLSGLFSRRPSFDFSLPPDPDGFDARAGSGLVGGSTPQGRGPSGPGMIDLGLGGMNPGQGSMGGPASVGPNFGPSPAGSSLSAGPQQVVPQQATAPGMMGAMGIGGGPMGAQAGSGMGMGTMDKWGTTAPQIKSDYFSNLGGPMVQVEAIGTWSEFCFFVSLFMRHQHALVPLIHKPTFAMDVLNRKDQRDEAFRGLLFSIVTYTICQCPINMMSNDFSRERLLTLLERCQQASRLIQIRYLSRPNLIVAASTELDILSSQATNKPELTAALFSDAQRIAYTLRLNAVTPPEGASAVDVELGRRIFWHLYSTDRTNVMNGGYMLLHHHEIIPPLPLEIDDEHLSTSPTQPHPQLSPAVAQTPNKQTYISGFVALCRIFVILGECQQRHRTLINDPEAGQDMPTLMRWLDGAVERLRRITDGFASDLPLRTARVRSGSNAGAVGGMSGMGTGMGMPAGMGTDADADSEATAGIQQANICITALCAEFALLDFRLALRPEEDLRSEREKIAKKAYATLSGIPIEYLASNGEAMRGKVLRTILALFNASTSPEELGDSVWDWWSMYSQVQFVQVIPSN